MAESTDLTKEEEQGKKAEELQKEIIEGKKTPEQLKAEALAAEEKDKGKVKKVKKEEETPPVTTEPPPGEGAEGFEQKYLVLQGKYDTEVPLLMQQVKDGQQTIANLNVIVDSVQKEPVPGKEKKEEEPVVKTELKSEDIEAYGAEMIKIERPYHGDPARVFSNPRMSLNR